MDCAEATPMAAVGDQVAFVRSCEDRFWVRVDRTGGPDACWPWTVSFSERGYGRVTLSSGGRQLSVATHRVAYMLDKGAIPDGWEIDHLCENRSCSNPAHLEAVTREENARRYRARHPAVGSIEYREYPSGPRWRVRFRENGKNRAVTFLSERAAVEYQQAIERRGNADSARQITLTEFLLARIAEDEAAATNDGSLVGDTWTALEPDHGTVSCDVIGVGGHVVARSLGWEASHIARHDPARVLAECEAKRLLIERVGNPDWAGFRILALPYADHPGYRPEWLP